MICWGSRLRKDTPISKDVYVEFDDLEANSQEGELMGLHSPFARS